MKWFWTNLYQFAVLCNYLHKEIHVYYCFKESWKHINALQIIGNA